jgi:hypothetical protein
MGNKLHRHAEEHGQRHPSSDAGQQHHR